MEFNGIVWNLMEFNGIQWNRMAFNGIKNRRFPENARVTVVSEESQISVFLVSRLRQMGTIRD